MLSEADRFDKILWHCE